MFGILQLLNSPVLGIFDAGCFLAERKHSYYKYKVFATQSRLPDLLIQLRN